CSYFHHYGKYHRPPPGAVVDQLPDPVVDVLLEELDLADVVGEQLPDNLVGLVPHLREELLRLGEAAGDHLGRGDRPVRERRHHDQDAVLGQVAAVAERDVGDVTDAETV